jgi:glycosyltransferase involved in cell wall biosynthesis
VKIIAIIDKKIGEGGGFDQSLNAILQMKRICKDQFEFEVFTSCQENTPYLSKLGIDHTYFSYSLFDRLLAVLGVSAWCQIFQRRFKYIGRFEKSLIKHNCDLVYFVSDSSRVAALQNLNYIITVWDICHRDTPEFPEVRNFHEFHKRESRYVNYLAPAFLVITDSPQLVDRASKYYGIDRNRFLAMPFSPSPFLNQVQVSSKVSVLNKYDLDEGYFYYPAQFWAHKNHIRILQALLVLGKEKNWIPKVVFSGKDYGNLSYLKKFVEKNGLNDYVSFLGFVPSDDMKGLYEGALAVVMPTYFGPTNLPPLEAWSVGKPLIYSEHLAEQAGDAALLVNPDDAQELAMAMHACLDEQKCSQLVGFGVARLNEIDAQRKVAEEALSYELEKFSVRRLCWES